MPTTPETLDLSGRTALVTGAASGIGAACVERLVAAGARVWAVDRDAEGLSRFADLDGVDTVPTDLSDLSAVDELPADVDVLVNNAGIQHVSPIHEFPVETWDLIIRLMLTSPFRLTRRVLPHMYAQASAGSSTSPACTGCARARSRRPTSRPNTVWRACPR
jgi:3-hydroxybutyrate dehydrogenase